jgi:hypothetical protein
MGPLPNAIQFQLPNAVLVHDRFHGGYLRKAHNERLIRRLHSKIRLIKSDNLGFQNFANYKVAVLSILAASNFFHTNECGSGIFNTVHRINGKPLE